jgi:hypothetical protein
LLAEKREILSRAKRKSMWRYAYKSLINLVNYFAAARRTTLLRPRYRAIIGQPTAPPTTVMNSRRFIRSPRRRGRIALAARRGPPLDVAGIIRRACHLFSMAESCHVGNSFSPPEFK